MLEGPYYKIVNAEKKHHGFEFKDGLNVDTVPFNALGSCEAGGIYFSNAEYIFNFLDYGVYLCLVEIPEDALVYEEDNKMKVDKLVLTGWYDLREVDTWKLELFSTFAYSKYVMDWAAGQGLLDVVKWLSANRSEGCTTAAMDKAAVNGHLHVVQWLSENRSEGCTVKALLWSCVKGHLHVVKWLRENRSEGYPSDAMAWAAASGQLHVVQWMFKWLSANRLEVCTKNAINLSILYGQSEIAQWLKQQTNHIDSS